MDYQISLYRVDYVDAGRFKSICVHALSVKHVYHSVQFLLPPHIVIKKVEEKVSVEPYFVGRMERE